MTASNGLGTYGNGAGVVTPTAHKLAHLGLVSKTGAGTNTVRPGLFFDGVTTIVAGTANMSYDVAAFTAVSSRGGTAGAVFFANDGTVNVVTTAAPGTDSRIDVVYVWQREFSLDGGTTAPVIGVVQGAVAASPVAPSLSAFPGAIELARITVPAGVTATNSGTTITQTAPFTALDGGPIPVRNVASLPAVALTGSLARAIDTDTTYRYSGSAWRVWSKPPATYVPAVTGGTLLSGSLFFSVSEGVVHLQGMLTLSGVSAGLGISTPTGLPQNIVTISTIGTASFEDVGTALFMGTCAPGGAETITLYASFTGGSYDSIAATSGTVPFTWASGDKISVSASYVTTA